MRRIGILFHSLIQYLIRNIPGGIGRRIRYFYYKNKFGKCGKNIYIDIGVIIISPSTIYLENNIWIDNYVILLSGKPERNNISIFEKKNPDYEFNEGELHIGSNVHIAPFCVIQSHGGISIGRNCGIASGAKIYSYSNHYKKIDDPTDTGEYFFTPLAAFKNQAYVLGAVVLQDNCAVGLNSIILPCTTIPKGTWIGVNVFIQGRNLKANAIYGGEQAKYIKDK